MIVIWYGNWFSEQVFFWNNFSNCWKVEAGIWSKFFFFLKKTDHKFKRIIFKTASILKKVVLQKIVQCILWLYLYCIPLKLKISWNIQAGHTTSNRCTQNIRIYELGIKSFMSIHFRLRVYWVAGSKSKYF